MFDLRSPERRSLWPQTPALTQAQPSSEKEETWKIQAPEGIQAMFRTVSGGATGEIKVSLHQPDGNPWGAGTHFVFNARYKDGGDTRLFYRGIKKVHDPLSQTRRWKHYWLNK